MKELIKMWRADANYIMKRVRQGQHIDQTGRVISRTEARVLRRCARQLKRRYEKRI